MAFFKYTVANKEGKKLSGTVESQDEQSARTELNNLGFSIIDLHETTEKPAISATGRKFVFEALDQNGQLVSGTIPSEKEADAFEKLQKEYSLTVSAIWPEGAGKQEIADAKIRYEKALREKLHDQEAKRLSEQKHDQQIRAKIENVLKEVHILLEHFDQYFEQVQKNEINKLIDKLLRIKNSTNLDYILETANDLLNFIQDQEKLLAKKGLSDKKFQLKLETKKLLDELHEDPNRVTFAEDILNKIRDWKDKHISAGAAQTNTTKTINGVLDRIKAAFETPPEIQRIKNQIHSYNKQIWTFIQLYFKEATPEYRQKVKTSIKTILEQKKKAKHVLAHLKKIRKEQKKLPAIFEENLLHSFAKEINLFTGWLLTFYVAYYFAALYIGTKDFGLKTIPAGFRIYDSHIFKYALVIVFFLHAATALKLNFFRKNRFATIVIVPAFFVATTITILNF